MLVICMVRLQFILPELLEKQFSFYKLLQYTYLSALYVTLHAVSHRGYALSFHYLKRVCHQILQTKYFLEMFKCLRLSSPVVNVIN
jgi:hypothetical protein